MANKMQALVIRASGDAAIAGQIIRGLESKELTALKAEVKMLRRRDNAAWAHKLVSAKRKYEKYVKPHGHLYNAFWGFVGMMVLLYNEL